MHKKLPFIAFMSLSLMFMLTSCGESTSDRFTKEVHQLDSLAGELQHTLAAFNALDTTGIKSIAATQKENLKYIVIHYNDTMDRANGTMLTQYRGLKKSFKGFNGRYSSYKRELQFTIEQVDKLKTDLSKGIVAVHATQGSMQGDRENAMTPDDRAKLYFNNEMQAGTRMCSEVASWIQMATNARSSFNEMNPKVEEIIGYLKNKTPE